MERKRKGLTTGINIEGVNNENVTPDVNPAIEIFEVKPRYLTLSDGQVLDRTYQPEPNKHLPAMINCNRADNTDLSKSKQRRLAMVLQSLDKDVTGLDGKKVNLLSMVRYGTNGPTLKEIEAKLSQ